MMLPVPASTTTINAFKVQSSPIEGVTLAVTLTSVPAMPGQRRT